MIIDRRLERLKNGDATGSSLKTWYDYIKHTHVLDFVGSKKNTKVSAFPIETVVDPALGPLHKNG